MKSIVIGMGIGQLYKSVLTNLGYQVITVDVDANQAADYTSLDDALAQHDRFKTAHVCTPNYLHETVARSIAPFADIVFIEKPGLETAAAWHQLTADFPNTRFIMVKNNMWRNTITKMRGLVPHSESIKFYWINQNRIPRPGSWFTTKKLAWGGVSRDLMPHLLSLYAAVNDHWQETFCTGHESKQLHSLDTVTNTEYGEVVQGGVYDVDDYCKIKFQRNGRSWKLEANWADLKEDNRSVEFKLTDGTVECFDLGLCPEYAYANMIADAVENQDNPSWWSRQLSLDLWIHSVMEKLSCE